MSTDDFIEIFGGFLVDVSLSLKGGDKLVYIQDVYAEEWSSDVVNFYSKSFNHGMNLYTKDIKYIQYDENKFCIEILTNDLYYRIYFDKRKEYAFVLETLKELKLLGSVK